MIAGETEKIIYKKIPESYDNLFGKRKRRRKSPTPEQQLAKTERKQQFWGNLTNSLEGNGGLSNLFSIFKQPQNPQPEDFQINFGEQPKPEKKGVPPVLYYLVGGVAVIGVAYLGYNIYQKNQVETTTQNFGQVAL